MSTALYRRYRPETFAEVIGQEHVTAPLLQALSADRVSHAYLFSGPRGCGKTTSARILARSLNCARRNPDGEGRFPDAPCGECDSCVELSRSGWGSLDVVEIDAASHGGVDDARELRERATFAPARDRYKIYIIDEAHMVSSAGFNALLKIVEEPPEHVRFIFATTEPDRVLQTIRSRTHHYPFHLVPAPRLLEYLDEVCRTEGVEVGKGVLPLVVRAGAGSVRDSLSVLDQLIAGAGPEGVDYERAVALLGYTHASLLDDVIEALAAGDGASVFRVVDRVIGSGHDPRRFVEDVLERLRDLIVVHAVGENARTVLPGLPDDQLDRMGGQAQRFGAGELSRLADIANTALTEMIGATSPRLHLELLCARMLLPGADVTERGLTARVDRLERRVGMPSTGGAAAPQPTPAPAAAPSAASAAPPAAAPAAPPPAPAAPPTSAPDAAPRTRPEPAAANRGAVRPEQQGPTSTEPADRSAADEREPARVDPAAAMPARPDARPVPTGGGPSGGEDLDAIRRMWPDILQRLAGIRRGTWTLVSQNAQVAGYSGGVVRLAFETDGLARTFRSGSHAEFTRQALIDVLGLDATVEPVVGSAAAQSGPSSPPSSAQNQGSGQNPGTGSTAWAPNQPSASEPSTPPPSPPSGRPTQPDAAPQPPPQAQPSPSSAAEAAPQGDPAPARQQATEAAPVRRATVAPEHDVPDMNDPDAEDSGMVGTQVVEQLLGGRVIEVED